MARPFEFTQDIADTICNRIAEGESLRTICGVARPESLPGQSVVFRWLAENESFAKQYAYAREVQAEFYADDIKEISDGAATVDDAVTVARDRLRVDTRKWLASKLAPKKYGDKLALDHQSTGLEGLLDRLDRRSAGRAGEAEG